MSFHSRVSLQEPLHFVATFLSQVGRVQIRDKLALSRAEQAQIRSAEPGKVNIKLVNKEVNACTVINQMLK